MHANKVVMLSMEDQLYYQYHAVGMRMKFNYSLEFDRLASLAKLANVDGKALKFGDLPEYAGLSQFDSGLVILSLSFDKPLL